MEERSIVWSAALRAAGLTALGASAFPLATLLVGLITQSVGQTLQTATCGAALLGCAAVAVLVCMAPAARERPGEGTVGCGWLGGAVVSLLGQAVLAVFVGMIWGAMGYKESRHREPDRGRPASPRRSPIRPRGE